MQHISIWNINFFMKVKAPTLFIIWLLFGISSASDFIGGRLNHMETGMVELTSAG